MHTTAGDLFIDPNSFELSIWDGDGSSLIYHRKDSYLLAMRSWCSRHDNGGYKTNFWDWPFSTEDGRRWPDAVPEVARTNNRGEHRRNILHQDAIIDVLNVSNADNSRSIKNWSRISRRMLLNDTVHRNSLERIAFADASRERQQLHCRRCTAKHIVTLYPR